MRSLRSLWIGLVVTGLFLAMFLWGRLAIDSAVESDVAGARGMKALGTVVVVVPPGNEMGFAKPPRVTVRFRGHLYETSRIVRFSELRPGKAALLTYRVGRSGQIYLDLVEPQ